MTLQDAMADAILRAVLKNPEKFPEEIREIAYHHRAIWAQEWDKKGTEGELIRHVATTFYVFKEALAKYQLPELCTDVDKE